MQLQQQRCLVLALSLILWPLATNVCRADGTHLSENQLLLLHVSKKTVSSLATLDLTQMPPKPSSQATEKPNLETGATAAQTWTLARITPGPDSGGEATSFQMVTSGQSSHEIALPVIRWRGTFQGVATLTATGLAPIHSTFFKNYLFTVPWFMGATSVADPNANPSAGEMMDRYAPFASGGLALFRLSGDPAAGSLTTPPDPPPTMIPDLWQKDLGPAWQFLHAHSALFLPQNAVPHKIALRKMLTDPNPFLAIAACRALTQANLLSLPQMQAVLTQARGDRQAAFLFLIMRTATGPEWNQRLTMVNGLAAQATDASELTGILSGLNAIGIILDDGLGHQIAEQIRQRLTVLRPSGQADPTTAAILQYSKPQ